MKKMAHAQQTSRKKNTRYLFYQIAIKMLVLALNGLLLFGNPGENVLAITLQEGQIKQQNHECCEIKTNKNHQSNKNVHKKLAHKAVVAKAAVYPLDNSLNTMWAWLIIITIGCGLVYIFTGGSRNC